MKVGLISSTRRYFMFRHLKRGRRGARAEKKQEHDAIVVIRGSQSRSQKTSEDEKIPDDAAGSLLLSLSMKDFSSLLLTGLMRKSLVKRMMDAIFACYVLLVFSFSAKVLIKYDH